MTSTRRVALAATISLFSALPAAAQFDDLATPRDDHSVIELEDGSVLAHDASGTYLYPDWSKYFASGFFLRHGKRCGSAFLNVPAGAQLRGSQADCSNTLTIPSSEYDPSGAATVFDVPVVFHVLYANNGTGNIPDARIHEQVQILNDDFASLTNSKIRFHLATVDPGGNPTTGITRHRSNRWYNDGGNYAASIGWDTNRYLNIYTNTAGGNLGYAYVPNGGGVVGQSFDGVRLFWRSVGYTTYVPYNLGRTGTHEVGHYLGLYHTFDGGCGSSDCYASGDLICDTNPESSPNFSACQPSQRITCGNQDPVRNYMDYSEDACMDNFTFEQALRMRCTIENWRVDLANWDNGGNNDPPAQVGGESPSDGMTGVATSAVLAWGAASGATQYDVYFGSSPSPGLASSAQTGTSYDPGGLAANTTYYWRVDSENANGVTTGDVWSFTTAGGGTGGGDLPYFDGFESGGLAGWSTTGNVRVGGSAATGAYAVNVRRAGSLSRTLDPGGATSATLTWVWSANGFEASDTATAMIRDSNGNVDTVTVSPGSGYTAGSLTISGITGPLTIEFSCSADRNNERLYLDDVSVN